MGPLQGIRLIELAGIGPGPFCGMIPITRAITSREALHNLSYPIEWHEYAMGHQVCPQEIADIAAWLNQIYR